MLHYALNALKPCLVSAGRLMHKFALAPPTDRHASVKSKRVPPCRHVTMRSGKRTANGELRSALAKQKQTCTLRQALAVREKEVLTVSSRTASTNRYARVRFGRATKTVFLQSVLAMQDPYLRHPSCKKTKLSGDRLFSYTGPSVWNNLPRSVRHSDSSSSFKTASKTQLFQNCF